ncbi:MAG: endolytic transglycosylase MltG, partial [Anaerolineae bacterium]|nr:endolytic transglycosylase MltG [Anaerolineae bacterium]
MTNDVKRTQSRALWVLLGGGIAWIVVLIVIGVAYLTDDSPEHIDSGVATIPPGPTIPAIIGDVPTLAAVTHTPRPPVTPTITVTITPTITPPVMLSPAPILPILTATPTGDPVADTNSAAHVEPDSGAAAEAIEQADDQTDSQTSACAPPVGWEMYVVQPDDTLFAFELGSGGATTVEDIMAANCLTSRYLVIDQVIYLPSGAAENAPPSSPYVAGSELYASGPRTPDCPCTIRITEGWRREQIAEAVQAASTQFTGGDFLAVTGPGVTTAYDFANQRPANTSLEGFLFPGVYTLQNDTTAEQFRDMLLAAFDANIPANMRADGVAQGVSFYEVVIIASIVQREVRGADDQKNVASIIYNRVRDGSRLGATVTLQYPLGEPGSWWPRITNINFESPYNTYQVAG